MLTIAAVLRDVQAVIATRDTWTTQYTAVDQHHRLTDPRRNDACRWCLIGAIVRVYAILDHHSALHLNYSVIAHLKRTAVALQYPYTGLANINDKLGFDAVHLLLTAAIVDPRAEDTMVSGVIE